MGHIISVPLTPCVHLDQAIKTLKKVKNPWCTNESIKFLRRYDVRKRIIDILEKEQPESVQVDIVSFDSIFFPKLKFIDNNGIPCMIYVEPFQAINHLIVSREKPPLYNNSTICFDR
jgi:hypothetical protein